MRFGQQRPEILVKPAVVDTAGVRSAQPDEFFGLDQSGRLQLTRVDEVRIARAAGEKLIGGVAVAGRPEGTDLPVAHAGLGQEINKTARAGAEIADAVSTRQRRDVREHARGAGVEPGRSGYFHGQRNCRGRLRPLSSRQVITTARLPPERGKPAGENMRPPE